MNQAHDGSSSAVVPLAVTEGKGWRIRVLGLSTKNSSPYTTVAAGGRAEDLQATKSARVPVTIEMVRPTVETSIPAQAETGSTIEVRSTLNDSADMFDGFIASSTVQLSKQKVRAFGPVSDVSEVCLPKPKKVAPGKWEIAGSLSVPISAGSLYLRLNILLRNWRCDGCSWPFPSFVWPGAVDFENPVEIKIVEQRSSAVSFVSTAVLQ